MKPAHSRAGFRFTHCLPGTRYRRPQPLNYDCSLRCQISVVVTGSAPVREKAVPPEVFPYSCHNYFACKYANNFRQELLFRNYFFRRSRISLRSVTSSLGGGGVAGAASSFFLRLFIALITKKIQRATIRKSMIFWINIP